jgi:hypothetical protein
MKTSDVVWLLIVTVLGALGLFLFVKFVQMRNRQLQARTDTLVNTLAPQLGGTYHALDTDHLVTLPFSAFRDWGHVSRTVHDIVTFTGPFGYAAHAFSYDWNEPNINVFGVDQTGFKAHGYAPPERHFGYGVLIGLPAPVAPLVVSSFPQAGARSMVTGTRALQDIPTIAPGTPPGQAFAMLFRTAGDPAMLGRLLQPPVIDGLLRGPHGVHLEVEGSWLLAICLTGAALGVEGQLGFINWARWFASLVPVDALLWLPPPP